MSEVPKSNFWFDDMIGRWLTVLMSGHSARAAVVALCTVALVAPGFSQSDPAQTVSSASGASMKITGEVGVFGELYDMSGRANNRPSSTGRLYFRSTLTAWESISADLNLLLSSEGTSARQNINQLDFNPKWRWGEMHLGDFAEEYTPLTLSGIRIRGGSVRLAPGGLQFALLSGVTNRTVESTSDRRSFERTISGGRLGIGHEQGSSFGLTILTARDRLNSLTAVVNDTTVDSSIFDADMDSTQNPVTITPQENLVVSAQTIVRGMLHRLTWRSEFSGSALTRDRRADQIKSEDIPSFLTDIFTPRVSSSADYAYTSDVRLDLKKMAITAGYQYIGPGYVSLGVSSLLPDRRSFTGGMQFRHSRGVLRFDGQYQTDNLIDQKSATTTRTRLSGNGTYRLTRSWNANLAVILVGMRNDAAAIGSKVDYQSLMLRTGQTIAFSRQRGLKLLIIDYIFQHSDDPSPLRQTSRLTSHSGSLAGTIGVSPAMEITALAGLVNIEVAAQSPRLTQTYSLALRLPALVRKMTFSSSLVVAVQDPNTSFRSSLHSNYQVSRSLLMSAEFEMTNLRGGAASSHFDEVAGRLSLSRQF